MSETKYTKGEWVATNYGYEKWSVNGFNGNEVCSVWKSQNAHLIAAAPEMYKALSDIAETLTKDGFGCFDETNIEIGKLLAKARGEHE